MEKKSVKEMMEVIAAVEVVAVAIKKVMKDGKVDLQDAAVAIELGAQFPVLAAAVQGLGEIPAEVQEIDAQEAIEIVGKLYAIAKKVQEA